MRWRRRLSNGICWMPPQLAATPRRNAKISGTSPAEYWPVMTEGQAPEKLRRQVHLHALPVGWEQLDYATFLDRRRSLMAQVG